MSALEALLAPATAFPLEHLSPSSVDGYWKCPEQWRRDKLIVEEPRPVSAEALFGSAFHRAAEHNLSQKIVSHEDMTVDVMRDVTGDSFNEVVEQEKGTREIQWHDRKPAVVQAEVITSMVGTGSLPGWHQVLAPTIQPVSVERWVKVDTPAGVPLVGRIDVETDSGKIVDLKTSKRAKTQLDLDKSTAATGYLYARRAEGDPATGFSWATAIRTVKPQQQELFTERTDSELAQFERLLRVTVEQIMHNLSVYGPTEPWPAASTLAWYCAPLQCSYWSSCCWRGGAK